MHLKQKNESVLRHGNRLNFSSDNPALSLQTKLLQNSDYALLPPLIFISYKLLTFKDIFETLGEAGCFQEWNFGRNTDWNSWRIAVCSTEKYDLKN